MSRRRMHSGRLRKRQTGRRHPAGQYLRIDWPVRLVKIGHTTKPTYLMLESWEPWLDTLGYRPELKERANVIELGPGELWIGVGNDKGR